jgi:hypothetical protein
VLYQFQLPLEEEVSNFLIFWSISIAKSGERKKTTSHDDPANQQSRFGLVEL